VVNDQVNGHKRVDFGWITAKASHGITHGSQIDDGWHSSEILKDDAGRQEWNLCLLLGVLDPVENLLNVALLDREVIAVSDGTLQQDTDGVWELGCTVTPRLGQSTSTPPVQE
jgi:hypothetical protein